MSQEEFEFEVPDKLFFRIGEAATLIGVEPHVLRYWEGEFKLRPQRSSTGQRMYRRKDIARFMKIKQLLHDEGFTIAGARKTLADPGGSTAAPVADAGRLQDVLKRITAVRERIALTRARISSERIAGDVDGG